ncbi:MFS transporter [Idiomarina loihiensis]|jgi:PAT family beta-lactamase induction signal transducer AmpG|uniref:MFS family muropeptide transporter n=1 Tax=Idiomarina loihiensis (strain ATCC BAA-735 / DSM 15497 / L2-TR) TaxID=283942 RepID=Q5QWT1_IDILO|nr:MULTISPECIES: MFS transporter [Idiomarina]AAV82699.1 MFS family muropeptide transporter [Idiomarina loihiensis L2TR]AGM36741.1 major facilitator superfamily muropeptide transporter [Idiomarina loihiensis GSL 199]MRJ45847.1 MFS transporter [Idiomarina loihiensis]PHQ92593.1 MAG: MFS transporter [Idiomarina sp.]UTW33410.1 MFS transporter [Idiomarina loihiensis]
MALTKPTFWQDLKVYKQPRVLVIFVLGLASGFPWVMIGSALSAWLQEVGLTRSVIGYFGAVFGAYSINFLWAPIIDNLKIPILTRWLGQRRSWIFFCQMLIAGGCFALASLDIIDHLHLVGLIALGIAVSSATQDIAIDAYRIESFAENEGRLQSAGAAMTTAGWWTGYSGLGALPFFFVDGITWQWQHAYFGLGCIMLVLAAVVLFVRRTTYHQEPTIKTKLTHFWPAMKERVNIIVIQPIGEFFSRNGVKLAFSILAFIFLFKIGEAFLGRMSIVFYKEVGFTNAEIGTYSKLVTWWVTIIFALLGSAVNLRLGIIKGLLIGGVAMASSNLMFSWIALVGPDTNLFLSAVLIDGFTSAWSTVAFVAFISLLCNRTFTATQYALMASLGSLGKTVLSSSSGQIVDYMDGNWALFFVLTALMVIPSLIFLWFIRKPIAELERKRDEG